MESLSRRSQHQLRQSPLLQPIVHHLRNLLLPLSRLLHRRCSLLPGPPYPSRPLLTGLQIGLFPQVIRSVLDPPPFGLFPVLNGHLQFH